MPPSRSAIDLEREVGHPEERWRALIESIPARAVSRFADVEHDWLDLMWCLDAYRIEGVCPRGVGRREVSEARRLDAFYRGKGNWFATLLAALLEEQTGHDERLAPRSQVEGFSQYHQIDIAWPLRTVSVHICIETKVTGAPGYGSTGPRGAMSDFSNRRKELKFAATDLKLFHRQQETKIEHWGVWRRDAIPLTFFLWAARLREPAPRLTGQQRWAEDRIEMLVREAAVLVDTYLDGAGIYAWKLNRDRTGYESVPLPLRARASSLDDVLYRIASEISLRKRQAGGKTPPPEIPAQRAVQAELLAEDVERQDADTNGM
jgi:hypothetical protein